MARFGEIEKRGIGHGLKGHQLLQKGERESLSNPDWDVIINDRDLLMRVLQANLVHRQRRGEQWRGRGTRGRMKGLFGGGEE